LIRKIKRVDRKIGSWDVAGWLLALLRSKFAEKLRNAAHARLLGASERSLLPVGKPPKHSRNEAGECYRALQR